MPDSLKNWINDHDERWSFILLYVGTAIVLSVYASLFWVALLMLSHLGLEIWRHYIIKAPNAFASALWEVKLDIALILFAFVITIYGDMVMAVLGIGQAARAGQAVRGAQMLTRFAVIERALRIFFLTVDDITRVALIGWKVVKGKKSKINQELEEARQILKEEEKKLHAADDEGKLSKGDIFSLGFGAMCILLLCLSPLIMDISIAEAFRVILNELRPFG